MAHGTSFLFHGVDSCAFDTVQPSKADLGIFGLQVQDGSVTNLSFAAAIEADHVSESCSVQGV